MSWKRESSSNTASKSFRSLTTFSHKEAETLAAIASRIIPSDDSPGANEAGVLTYIDRVLAHGDLSESLRCKKGLKRLEEQCAQMFGKSFTELASDKQDLLLKELEQGYTEDHVLLKWPEFRAFFTQVRQRVIEGLLSDPKYGGNNNYVGWKLVGCLGEPQPFGYSEEEIRNASDVVPFYQRAVSKNNGQGRMPQQKKQSSIMSEKETFDVCIVGIGASGGLIASELARTGLSVVAFEAGPSYALRGSFASDEVAYSIGRQLAWNEQEVLVYNGRSPLVGPIFSRNKGVGGPLHWSALSFRFHESDFRVGSESGCPSGSSVRDWPISYGDLEPWYDKFEYEFGVAGKQNGNPYDAPRSRPYSAPPVAPTKASILFERATKELGYNPFPAPAAITTVDRYGGAEHREACNYCGFCSYYGCQRNAKASTLVVCLPSAIASGNLRILDESYVYKVNNNGGEASGVEFFDSSRKRRSVRAKVVVVCTSAIYTARLLLLSFNGVGEKSNFKGLFNGNGLIGKNLMFHQGVQVLALFDEPIHAERGPQTAYGIDDLNEDRPKSLHNANFIRGARIGLPLSYASGPIAFANAMGSYVTLPTGVSRWGTTFKDFISRYYTRYATVGFLSEDLPVESNRVELDGNLKDSYGLPVPRIIYNDHPNNLAMEEFFLKRVHEIALAMSAKKIIPLKPSFPLGTVAGHAMGTTRMGKDAETSVVNEYCASHDIANLFIGGAGPFVTGAGLNPTETIFALAYRIAERIRIGLNKGNL